MSLQALRDFRMTGKRPTAPVILIVGQKPAWMHDTHAVVVVDENTRPEEMDLRPLVGLWVAVVMTRPLHDLTNRLLTAMQRAKAKPYGLVTDKGDVLMGVAEPTQAHERNLRRAWEIYR